MKLLRYFFPTHSIYSQRAFFTFVFHFCIRNSNLLFRFLWSIRRVASLDTWKCWATTRKNVPSWSRRHQKKIYFVTSVFFETYLGVTWLQSRLLSLSFRFIYSVKKVHAHIHVVSIMKLKFFPLLLKPFEKWLIRSWCYWVWESFLLLFTRCG